MALKAAIELELLEIIVRAGPGAMLSPADIAAKLPTANPQAAVMVDRILRLLAAYSVVSCTVEAGDDGRPRISTAPRVCKYLTKNEDGVSLASMSLMNQDKVLMESWYYLKDAVLKAASLQQRHRDGAVRIPRKRPAVQQAVQRQHEGSLHHPHEEATPSLLRL
ncbi:unnamed protein product [Musa acuminata subsp. burmannicoides]